MRTADASATIKLTATGGTALANYGQDGSLVAAEQAATGGSIADMVMSTKDGSVRVASEAGGAAVTFGPGQATAWTSKPIAPLDVYIARYNVCP